MDKLTKEHAEKQLKNIIDQLKLTKQERDHLYECIIVLKEKAK